MLIRRGAEANLFLEDWYGFRVIKKMRQAKAYRISQLDLELRRNRTIREAQIIHSAKLAGVPTPTIYFIDISRAMIIMEYIEGHRVKEVLNLLANQERQALFRKIGVLIGRLHRNQIIHGDLTTSNMIFNPQEKLFFIDFGLAEFSGEVEKRGIDIHLMRRALQSTHYRYSQECFKSIVKGYTTEVGQETVKDVFDRVREIAKRGRYSTK